VTRDFFPAQLHKLQLSGSAGVATSGHGTIDLGSETLVPMDLQLSACWYSYPSEKCESQWEGFPDTKHGKSSLNV